MDIANLTSEPGGDYSPSRWVFIFVFNTFLSRLHRCSFLANPSSQRESFPFDPFFPMEWMFVRRCAVATPGETWLLVVVWKSICAFWSLSDQVFAFDARDTCLLSWQITRSSFLTGQISHCFGSRGVHVSDTSRDKFFAHSNKECFEPVSHAPMTENIYME